MFGRLVRIVQMGDRGTEAPGAVSPDYTARILLGKMETQNKGRNVEGKPMEVNAYCKRTLAILIE